jgi:3-methyladenine DNA glycosylase AlkD
MQAYMKSTMPFLGLDAPGRRRVVAAVLAAHPLPDGVALHDTVLALWRSARHREERYAALDLLRIPRHKRWLDIGWLPTLHEMLISSPWWDHNDEISGLALGVLLQRHPAELKPVLRLWAHDENLWLRRAAMLGQRSLKAAFDPVLLYDCILPSLKPSPLAGEFFIRKGMGWALRERSYDAPDEVQAFCREYADRLSPLTVREALKVIRKRA